MQQKKYVNNHQFSIKLKNSLKHAFPLAQLARLVGHFTLPELNLFLKASLGSKLESIIYRIDLIFSPTGGKPTANIHCFCFLCSTFIQ